MSVTHTQLPAGGLASRPRFRWWRSVVALAFMVAAVFLVRGESGHQILETGVNMQLPDAVADYVGFDENVSPQEIQILPKDTEFAKKRYIGPAPQDISVEIVLSGAVRSSLHRPQVCLVGQGWTIEQEQSIPIRLENGSNQDVRLLTITRKDNGQPYVGYYLYWFVGKDRTTDDAFQRIWLTSWDRLTRGVGHRWAYVIVSSILPANGLSEKKKLQTIDYLKQFTGSIIPLMQKPGVNPVALR